jgi:hydrogenase expression/formation protein HypD
MKYLSEFRNADTVRALLNELNELVTRQWNIMEICGGQTHSLVKNGILDLLPKEINMIHGPGCPVCVTPLNIIDKAIYLAGSPGIALFTFGDMIRVPGSSKSLMTAKAEGASVKIVYSPLAAVKYAKDHPEIEVVFFAVGFETTAPANALSVIQARKAGINNYSILTSHVVVPPAMEVILGDEANKIDGFLAAGHVCTIMGTDEYDPIAKKYSVPIEVTGFEPVDLLRGILATVKQLEQSTRKVQNQYKRVVKPEGNIEAKGVIEEVFEVVDREWRGIGMIPMSGFGIRKEYSAYDADRKFNVDIEHAKESADCIAGLILRGHKKPPECAMFGVVCKPENPLGAPMVSSEGACAAYYHFSDQEEYSNA